MFPVGPVCRLHRTTGRAAGQKRLRKVTRIGFIKIELNDQPLVDLVMFGLCLVYGDLLIKRHRLRLGPVAALAPIDRVYRTNTFSPSGSGRGDQDGETRKISVPTTMGRRPRVRRARTRARRVDTVQRHAVIFENLQGLPVRSLKPV